MPVIRAKGVMLIHATLAKNDIATLHATTTLPVIRERTLASDAKQTLLARATILSLAALPLPNYRIPDTAVPRIEFGLAAVAAGPSIMKFWGLPLLLLELHVALLLSHRKRTEGTCQSS